MCVCVRECEMGQFVVKFLITIVMDFFNYESNN